MSWQEVLDKDDSAEWLETCSDAMREIHKVDRQRIANSIDVAALQNIAEIGIAGYLIMTTMARSIREWADKEAATP